MANKEIVRKLYQCCNQKDEPGIRALLAADYIEHNPDIQPGVEELIRINREVLKQEGAQYELVLLFADKEDGVAAYTKIKVDGKTVMRTADMYRVEGGLIRERWSIRQRA